MGIIIAAAAVVLIIVLLAVYAVSAYNGLTKARDRVRTQWAQIDVQLVRRSDLIPNLVETVRAYAAHEQELFAALADARVSMAQAASPAQAMQANDELSGQLQRLYAVSEGYPALAADRGFAELRSALKEAEDKIAYARQFYNDTVLIYKDRLHQFPSSVIAGLFGFQDEHYLAADEGKRQEVAVSFS